MPNTIDAAVKPASCHGAKPQPVGQRILHGRRGEHHTSTSEVGIGVAFEIRHLAQALRELLGGHVVARQPGHAGGTKNTRTIRSYRPCMPHP